MYKLANSLFFDLLHKTTVQRGLDPRRFALFSFGGTAGMHVGAYGEDLGVSTIVIPHSVRHGAFGLVMSDIAHEDQITRPLRAPFDLGAIAEIYDRLEERITKQLEAEGFERSQMRLQPSTCGTAARYIVTSPFVGDDVSSGSLEETIELFERLYEEKYGPQSAYREASSSSVSVSAASESSASRSSTSRRSAARIHRPPSSTASRRGSTRPASSRTFPATTSSGCGPATGSCPAIVVADHDPRDPARPGSAAGRAPEPRPLRRRLMRSRVSPSARGGENRPVRVAAVMST